MKTVNSQAVSRRIQFNYFVFRTFDVWNEDAALHFPCSLLAYHSENLVCTFIAAVQFQEKYILSLNQRYIVYNLSFKQIALISESRKWSGAC